jgi:hypothetical protein
LTFLALAIGGLWASKKEFGFLPFDIYWIRSLLIFGLLGIVLVFIDSQITGSFLFRLIINSLLSIILYFGALITLGLDNNDKELFKAIKSSLFVRGS